MPIGHRAYAWCLWALAKGEAPWTPRQRPVRFAHWDGWRPKMESGECADRSGV